MNIGNEYYMMINIAVLVLAVVNIGIGIHRGFLRQLIDCISLVASLFVAWLTAPVLAEWIALVPASMSPGQDTVLGPFLYAGINLLVWFVLIFILCRLVFLLLKPVVKVLSQIPIFKQANQLLGGVFSLVSTAVWLMIFTLVLSFPYFENGREVIDETLLSVPGKVTASLSEQLASNISQAQIEQIKEGWDQLTDEDREIVRQWLQEYFPEAGPAASLPYSEKGE